MDSGKLPMEVKCPNCKKYVVTKTKVVKNANMSFCICCCCCLPCCIHDNIVTVLHLCPNCKALISFDSEINTWALCLTTKIFIRINTFGALFKSIGILDSVACVEFSKVSCCCCVTTCQTHGAEFNFAHLKFIVSPFFCTWHRDRIHLYQKALFF